MVPSKTFEVFVHSDHRRDGRSALRLVATGIMLTVLAVCVLSVVQSDLVRSGEAASGNVLTPLSSKSAPIRQTTLKECGELSKAYSDCVWGCAALLPQSCSVALPGPHDSEFKPKNSIPDDLVPCARACKADEGDVDEVNYLAPHVTGAGCAANADFISCKADCKNAELEVGEDCKFTMCECVENKRSGGVCKAEPLVCGASKINWW